MRKIPLTQTAVGAWAASSTIRTNLEREGIITRVVVTFEMTPSATHAAANQQNSFYRVMENFRIRGGGHTFVELPSTGESGNGAVLLHYLNNEDFGGMPGFPDQQTVAAPNRTYEPVSFVFHFGSRPRDQYGRDNPYDLTGGIPSKHVTDLVAEVTTGLNSVTDDGITISSGTFRYTLYTVIGTGAEIQAEMQRQGVSFPQSVRSKYPGTTLMMPAWIGETWAIDTLYSDYAYARNVPVGRYIKRLAIASQDATGTRAVLANDEITGFKLNMRLQDQMKIYGDALACTMKKGNFFVADDAVELGHGGFAKGILIPDFRTIAHPDYGIDCLINPEASQVGGTKIGLTVTTNTSGDDGLLLYEGAIPFGEPL